jgi:hypothetical protein
MTIGGYSLRHVYVAAIQRLFLSTREPVNPPVRLEEFRLRFSPLRAGRNSLADHSHEQRANSPFGISLVRLRDDDAIATIIGLMRLTFGA